MSHYYPHLNEGIAAQFPIRRTTRYRTVVNANDLTKLASDLKVMISEFKVDRSQSTGVVLSGDAPDLITWDDSIRFGIDSIDSQHHHLVDLVNKLHRAMRSRAEVSSMPRAA